MYIYLGIMFSCLLLCAFSLGELKLCLFHIHTQGKCIGFLDMIVLGIYWLDLFTYIFHAHLQMQQSNTFHIVHYFRAEARCGHARSFSVFQNQRLDRTSALPLLSYCDGGGGLPNDVSAL